MADDVLTNKVAAIERSLDRIEEEYAGEQRNLYDNITRQDSIVLNLQRACHSAIDLAMHLVQIHGLGVPQESRDAFALLVDAGHLDQDLGDRMMRMVGFRNVAIHEYQRLNLDVVKSIRGKRDLGNGALYQDRDQFHPRARRSMHGGRSSRRPPFV